MPIKENETISPEKLEEGIAAYGGGSKGFQGVRLSDGGGEMSGSGTRSLNNQGRPGQSSLHTYDEAVQQGDNANFNKGADSLRPSKYPDGNPKTAFGFKKPPLWYVPMRAVYMTALAHLQGALKYGHFNWRKDPVSASVYINATIRHIAEWKEGGEVAADSGIHHLAHACACLNIVMDAQLHGTLIDDRDECITDFDKFYKDLEPLLNRIHKDWGPK